MKTLLLLSLSTLAATSLSNAAITIYSTEASFRAAVLAQNASASLLEENFNSFITDTPLNSGVSFNGYSASGTASLSQVDVSPFITTTQHPIDGTPYIYASLRPASGGTPANLVELSFAANTFAFGADVADTNNIGNGTRMVLSNGETANLPNTALTQRFWGFVSDTPFTSATLRTNSGDGIGIDNSIVAIPEPSTTTLVILSIGLLTTRKRRK